MKILVMLYCSDVNQLLVSDLLKSEFDKLGHNCVVKDLTSYRFENHGNKELAYTGGLYDDLRFGEYDAIVFLHSYPARIFSRIKAIKNIDIKSFLVQTDFSLHFSYFKLDIDKYFIPNGILAKEYISRGVPVSKIAVSGIPSVDLKFGSSTLKHSDVFCLILADGYDSSDVLEITQKSGDVINFNISFAVLSFDSEQYRIYGKFSDIDENFIVYSYEDSECFRYIPKPDVIISNSCNVNIYSAMKCKVPIILFDAEGKSETESFAFLSQTECFLTCKTFEDVFNALKCRFFDTYLGLLLSEKCEKNSDLDAVPIICENIISFNNKYDN